MKNNYNQRSKLKVKWLLVWVLLILPFWGFSQNTGITVTWDFQVGCTNVESSDPKERDNIETWETIGMGFCIRVCEKSQVNYTLNSTANNISSVTWNVAGGTINSTSNNPYSANVSWGQAGSGSVIITILYTNNTQETKTICIEKIDGPRADFKIAGGGDPRVCQNTPVFFDNLSNAGSGSGIVNYEWNFGDGSPTTSIFEPSHAYSAPGTFEVTLKVTNQCNCTDEYSMVIEVMQAVPVEISCVGVVCENTEHTYTANNSCKGEWDVIGGTPLSMNGNEIQIRWDMVDPADGFGYIKYRSECGCPAWTVVKVPVIVSNAVINGPTTVCTKKQYKYEMPRWPTTEVQWDVNGPAPAQATYSSQRNEIYLKFDVPGTYTLSNIYNNTLLGCGGKSEMLTIVVTEPLVVTGGQAEVCTGNSLTFNSNGSGNVTWDVTYNGSVVSTQTTPNPFQYQFQNAGTYIITAHTPGGCVGEGTVVKALPVPSAPSGNITGDQLVCAGVPYTYTLSPTNAGFIPVWSVTNGTIQGSNTGSSVTVIFNANATNYTVSVQNRTTGGLGCLSAPINYSVQKVDLSTISVSGPAGQSVFCPSSSATFVANFNGIVPDDFYWTLGNSNFGSLLPHPTDPNAIIVSFNEISNGNSVSNLILNVVKCGQPPLQIPYQVTLQELPVISLVGGDICEGNPTINVVVNIPSNINSGDLLFTFPNGSTEPYTLTSGGTQTIPIPNHFVNNTSSVISQSLQLQLNAPNGCNYVATASANFNIIPELDITITPGYFYSVCPANGYDIDLNAQIPSGTPGTFQWYHNGVFIPGATGNTYSINPSTQASPGGNYYVIVTSGGCQTRSQSILVSVSCGTIPPCNISPNPDLNVTAVWTSCDTIVATATFVGSPDSYSWEGSPGLQLQSSNANTATFTVVEAGVHNVALTLNYGSCSTQDNFDIVKNYKPDFNASITCNSNGTYNVTLTDTSLLSGVTSSDIAYSYTMNGGNQQGGQTVTYTGLQPGTSYNFAIKLDGPGSMPDCVYTESVTMPVLPDLQFSVSNTTICKGEVVTLTIPPGNYLPDHVYRWIFAQTSYITSSSITPITLNDAGSYDIELEVTTPNGCTYLSPITNIVVNEANVDVDLTGINSNICENSTLQPVIIVTPIGGNPISNYQWMNGNTPVGAPSSPTFTPTESGSYWVVLTDANTDCFDKSTASEPVLITIRKAPQVSIVGSSQACENNTVTLQGVVTDSNLQYEWTQSYNGGGNTVVQTGTSATSISLTTGALSVGTYVYSLRVWSANDPSCFGISTFTVTVSSPPPAPVVNVNIIECLPYQVELTIQNPGAGTYNWSNGAFGSSIVVTKGGLYQVIYTAPSGCKSSVQISVPHSVEDLMWIFPTGCYDMCPGDAYIVGPYGTFTNHEWQYFGTMQQGGYPGFVDPYWPQNTGTHNLLLQQGACFLQSGDMNISPSVNNPGCAPRECKIEVVVKEVKRVGNSYLLFGDIFNFGTQSVTVTFSSANGYGNYQPGSMPISGGGSSPLNPLIFTPNSSFPGGADEMLVTANVDGCKVLVKIIFDDGVYSKSSPAYVQTNSELLFVPNPAKEEVKISFNTGNTKVEAKTLYIYDQSGILKYQQKLQGSKGEARLNISQWLQGMYLVSIITTADPLQGKLLKK